MQNYLRVYAKIDLDAICGNIRAVRSKIGDGVRLMAVIKADAYGHGAVPVGLALQDLVDGFAIAVVEEGVVLRQNGIHKPMLILGYTDSYQYPDVIRNDIAQTIYSYEMAEQLSQIAVAMGAVAKIHIKVDTGMGRIGFLPDEASVEEVKRIAALPNLEIEGLFTHFAKADMVGREYTQKQFERFCWFSRQLASAGIRIPVQHVANSAAIMDYEETYLDQVRSGIITYGMYPSEEVDFSHLAITPAMELQSHVIHVKEVPAGTSIGYGGTYVTERTSRIATIPVGYGDGFPRSLSNKGRVLIRGEFAPIVGRVCMDQFMVDVTHLPQVEKGDVVTLMGKDKEKQLTVEEVAGLAGSFNYEFCCDVGRRVPRVYYKNGKYDRTVNYLNC